MGKGKTTSPSVPLLLKEREDKTKQHWGDVFQSPSPCEGEGFGMRSFLPLPLSEIESVPPAAGLVLNPTLWDGEEVV